MMGDRSRPHDEPAPKLQAPDGTTDTHMHVFAPGFPLHGAPPPTSATTLDDYARVRRRLGIDRAVVVQPNAYRTDNACLEDALMRMGGMARGVAVVTPEVPEVELERLDGLGVRGARIMNMGGAPVGLDRLHAVAGRIAPFGWHTIVQFDGCDIEEHAERLAGVPGTYVIDHIGKFLTPVDVDSAAFACLLNLVDRGNCFVKLSACYETSRCGPPDYEDVGRLAEALAAHAPERMLWASNWPHVGVTRGPCPDDARMLDLLLDWAPQESVRRRILVDNPAGLYGFG